MRSRILVSLSVFTVFGVLASAQTLNVTGNINANQVTTGTLGIGVIPTGTSSTTVAVGNDSRFLNATSLNGTSIATLTGIMKMSSGTPSNAAASDVIALWSGTCSSSTWLRGDGTCAAPGGSGTVNSGTTGHLAYYASSTTAVSDMGSDFTFSTHTLAGGSSAILDLSLTSPTAGFKLPSAAGAAPTGDGYLAVNTTNHTIAWGSNGTTIVGAAAATGTGTATTCSNQVITAISGTAAPTCTSLTGAYLPNPSGSSLGGTQSGTAGANQFMTGISTSGVPQFAQPAFSNLSGSATASQLPTAVPVWNTYSVTYSNLSAASTSTAYTVVTLTSKQIVCGLVEHVTTAFAGTSITGLTATVGDSNGTSTTYSSAAYNLLAAASNTNTIYNNVSGAASWAGGNLQVNATSTGANLSALSAGALSVSVCTVTLP